jgi:outer membrane protein assembly factor BamD
MFRKLLLPLIAIIALTACNREYDKLLKSDDFGLKLQKAYEYFEAGEYYKAEMLFEQARPFYRGTAELEKIYFHYAYTQYHQKKYILSTYYFKDFTQNYSTSQYAEEAAYMSAYSNYEISPNPRLEQTSTMKAIEGFQLFINAYPNSERVERCNVLIDELRTKLEKKAINNADLYFKLREYQAATHSYKNVLKDYPDTRAAKDIRIKIIRASYELAINSVDNKKEERLEQTLKEYEEFVDRHPEDTEIKEVKKIRDAAAEQLKKIRNS